MRAGAAWRGWCYLSTAYDIQLGFKKMMRCAYSHVIAKVAGRGDLRSRCRRDYVWHIFGTSGSGQGCTVLMM